MVSHQEVKPRIKKEEIHPTISCDALLGIPTQTLKIEGNINKKKVIVLVNYESTHNLFIVRYHGL